MIDLFTYGSLMCDDIMFAVIGCQLQSSNAVLYDYYRSRVRNEEYPGITPQPGAQVDGVLYLDLPESAIERLDVFEGKFYERQVVQVRTENFDQMNVMAYVIKPHYSHILTYTEWSYTHFLETGKQKFEMAYFGFHDIQQKKKQLKAIKAGREDHV